MFHPGYLYRYKQDKLLFCPLACSMNDNEIRAKGEWISIDLEGKEVVLYEDNIKVLRKDFKDWVKIKEFYDVN